MIKKILGLILLFLGLIIILYSLYASFNIFTAKSSAPEIFKTEKQALIQDGGQGIEAQFQNMINEQLKGMIPAGSIPNMLNLIAWSVFAGILMVGGGQVSGLGIKLLK